MNQNPAILVVAATAALVFLVFLVLFFSVLRLWVQALLTGIPASVFDIIGMRLRRTPPTLIVHAGILLSQNGVRVPVREIETCYLAHGGQAATPTELAALVLERRRKTS